MKTNRLCILLTTLLLTASLHAQQNDPYDQRGVQFAAQGTDFWVCFPRTYNGFSENHSRLYVVSERDCDVTVSNPLLDYSQTVHIMRREMCGPDTNYITVPFGITRIIDTISLLWPRIYNYSYAGQPGNSPQPRGFHVTSTDTVSLFIWVNSVGESGACNVLPTEMLRDEYVVQVPFSMRRLNPSNHYPYATSLNIVAVEDSTIVDIVLSDWDWVNRHPGDTVTVTLRAGEIYHIGAGEPREKYYPLISPYGPGYKGVPSDISMPLHSYDTSHVLLDTFVVDLSGTRIKARDCKRIAVFEGGEAVFLPAIDDYYHQCDMLLEQSLPTKYSGKEYLIPNVYNSDTDYIRITGLHDGTVITIRDDAVRSLTVDAYETEWFCMMDYEGPFYITTSEPAIVKEYLMHGMPRILDIMGGDPAFYAVRPVEWWHNGCREYLTSWEVTPHSMPCVLWNGGTTDRLTLEQSLMWMTTTIARQGVLHCIFSPARRMPPPSWWTAIVSRTISHPFPALRIAMPGSATRASLSRMARTISGAPREPSSCLSWLRHRWMNKRW